jgi:tetratricopeptide (TPR) repeat protein
LNRYPDAPAAPRTRERIATLNNQFAEKAFKSAMYYFRLKAYDSAILYFRDLLATYPRADVASAALIKLIEAYHAIGYAEEEKETCGYFRQNHPARQGSTGCVRSRPIRLGDMNSVQSAGCRVQRKKRAGFRVQRTSPSIPDQTQPCTWQPARRLPCTLNSAPCTRFCLHSALCTLHVFL